MKTLAYSVNVEELFNTQDDQLSNNVAEKNRRIAIGIANKTRLLKIVLPYAHSVYALHNRKCNRAMDSTTGCKGLLGLNKVNIEKKIDYIVNTDSHFVWGHNFGTFKFDIGESRIMIWLNDREGGCYRSTPHLDYSMTSINKTYGTSIKDELIAIAQLCSKYTDEWK
tara:strand:- start:204 stop:704 length:501 start_codon:yes stop_codon:yes gene_type:complete